MPNLTTGQANSHENSDKIHAMSKKFWSWVLTWGGGEVYEKGAKEAEGEKPLSCLSKSVLTTK